jgi:hypothetical protein
MVYVVCCLSIVYVALPECSDWMKPDGATADSEAPALPPQTALNVDVFSPATLAQKVRRSAEPTIIVGRAALTNRNCNALTKAALTRPQQLSAALLVGARLCHSLS